MPAVSLRYFNVYGPGQEPESEYAAVVPRFIVACMRGERPVIHGDGEQSRDFTYIDDVVEANLRAARTPEQPTGGRSTSAAGGEPTASNRLLAIVADLGVTPDPCSNRAAPATCASPRPTSRSRATPSATAVGRHRGGPASHREAFRGSTL